MQRMQSVYTPYDDMQFHYGRRGDINLERLPENARLYFVVLSTSVPHSVTIHLTDLPKITETMEDASYSGGGFNRVMHLKGGALDGVTDDNILLGIFSDQRPAPFGIGSLHAPSLSYCLYNGQP